MLFRSGESHFYSMNSTSLAPARQFWLLHASQRRALCVTPLEPVLPHWAPSAGRCSSQHSVCWDGINLAHWCCGAIVVEIRKMVSLPQAPPCQVAKLCTSQEPPQHHSSAATLIPVRPALEGGSAFKQGHGAAFLCQNAFCHSPPAFLTRQCSSADTTQSPTFSINIWSYSQTYHINDFLHFCEHKLIW